MNTKTCNGACKNHVRAGEEVLDIVGAKSPPHCVNGLLKLPKHLGV
jgi:hypothetical protein